MSPDDTTPHTVYILGAGFSREANIPLQREILRSIRNLSLSDAPADLVTRYLDAWSKASFFLRDVFGSKDEPSLEDVFTLLDETINYKLYCRGYSWQDLNNISKSLNEAILYLFHLKQHALDEMALDFYSNVAAYFLEQAANSELNGAPFSIISLNWDCVLENAFSWCFVQHPNINAFFDYCCVCTPIPETVEHPVIREKDNANTVRMMKLHGSTNWLLCPNCNRMYNGLGASDTVWTKYILSSPCPICQDILSEREDNITQPPLLEPFLITPTFIKRFENPHIKMTWHNAYIDLCKARKLVFIGYSLPEADYRIRTLLKRAVRQDIEVDIVLAPNDKPKKKEKNVGVTRRYTQFFGSAAKLQFFYEGVRGYFKERLAEKSLEERLKSIKTTQYQ